MEQHIDDMREGIESKKRAIARGDMPMDAIPMAKAEIDKEEARLNAILESKPKLSPQEKDMIANIHKELGEKISESMFTYDEMHKGFADPHKEVNRMMKPIIKIDKATAEICEENGIKVERSRNTLLLTRNAASKMYKIIGRYLGENGNVEQLRRRGLSHSTEAINR